jgi:hypothetical protein
VKIKEFIQTYLGNGLPWHLSRRLGMPISLLTRTFMKTENKTKGLQREGFGVFFQILRAR